MSLLAEPHQKIGNPLSRRVPKFSVVEILIKDLPTGLPISSV
jgi:hypothetical protein